MRKDCVFEGCLNCIEFPKRLNNAEEHPNPFNKIKTNKKTSMYKEQKNHALANFCAFPEPSVFLIMLGKYFLSSFEI